MARTRSIKPGFFKNEILSQLPFLDRLLFIGLWTLADKSGKLEDRPVRIKGELFPYQDLDLEASLCRLDQCGFILRYRTQGTALIMMPTWAKHQSPHKKENTSTWPDPEETGPNPGFSGPNPDPVHGFSKKLINNGVGLVPAFPDPAHPSTLPPVVPSTLPPVNGSSPDSDIASLAESLHARHPANGCGKSVIKKHLRVIVGKMNPERRVATLAMIDSNHQAWCRTDNWERGFSKGLENWLAPKMERWKDPPPKGIAARSGPPLQPYVPYETIEERQDRLDREDAARLAAREGKAGMQ